MKRIELRKKLVHYCDVCGDEITGNFTTFGKDTENEKHACSSWNKELGDRCDSVLRKKLMGE